MADTKMHPVWDVYDLHRTARLNNKYYGHKLAFWKRLNCLTEISIAISAPSSVITGLCFWDYTVGEIIWKSLFGLTAIIAFLQPFFKIIDHIEAYDKTVHGYRILENQLDKIVFLIKQDKRYSEKHRTLLDLSMETVGKLKENAPESKVNKKLRKRYQFEVMNELPVDNFYIPEEAK